MKLDLLSAQPDRVGRYKAQFSDGTMLRLYRQTVQDYGLYTGCELSEEEYIRLTEASAEMSAKMRAVRIVSASSVSKNDLQHRLVEKGEDAQSAEKAVAWMEELHLIDDSRTAEQVVNRCISKGYGLARAKQALYEKRIPKELWAQALLDYPDQEEYIAGYIQANLSSARDGKNVKKVVDALLRKGHSYSVIRRVMDTQEILEDDYG